MNHPIIRSLMLMLVLCVGVVIDMRAVTATGTMQQQRPTLRREDRGAAVRDLQRLLNAWIVRAQPAGIQALPLTGYFGALTDRTVRAFQGAHSLAVDGIVGPRTWAALDVGPPDALVPIVDGDTGFVLGGSRGGAWVDAKTTAAALQDGQGYRLYSSTGAVGTRTGSKPVSAGVPCEEAWVTRFATAPVRNTTGIGNGWNPLPRVPQAVSVQSAVYRDAVATLLRARGIANPDVRLTSVWRIDLEGDGTSEVVLSATRQSEGYPSFNAAAGDYSLVAVRKVVNGAVQTIVLDSDVYPEARPYVAPEELSADDMLDLNGDGRMEIIVDSGYFEGKFTNVYELDGTRATEVLATGCGS